MKLLKKTALAACISAALVTAVVPTTFAADKKEVEKLFSQIKTEYEVFTLPNGLTTLVVPNHTNPQVYIGTFFNVGSKDEPEGWTGFAHLYEHLLFQGTKNAPGDFFSHLQPLGASEKNGMTSRDLTMYYEKVPTGALDRTLWLESDRVANVIPTLDQSLLDNQREVVKNEKRQRENPSNVNAQKLINAHFYPVDHPYGHDVIGTMKDINGATLENVHKWFNDNYGAKNCTLILAGDITVEDAKKKVAKYFSDMPAGTKMRTLDEYVPEFDEIKRATAYDAVTRTTVNRMWHIPSKTSKDGVLLEYLALALAGDKSAPLVKRLKDELGYVENIGFSVSLEEVSGAAALSYTIRKEANVAKETIDKIIDEEMAKFLNKGPDMAILERKLLGSDVRTIESVEDATTLGSMLLDGLRTTGDPEFFKTKRQWQVSATRKELKAVANRWLTKPYFELTAMPQPEGENMAVAVDRSKMPDVQETPVNIQFPEMQEATLANGMEIVLIENHDTPMVDLVMEFATGSAADYKYTPDTAERVFHHMQWATKKYDEIEYAEKKAEIAARIGGGASEKTSKYGFSRVLTPYLGEALDLLQENLFHPAFPESQIQEERDFINSIHDRFEASPAQTSQQLFDRMLWGENHQLGQQKTRKEELASVSREAIIRFHKNELGPNNTKVWIYGDITLERAKTELNKRFAKWKKVTPTPLEVIGKPKTMKGKVVLMDAPNAQSASIRVGHLVPKYNPETADAVKLANGPLGGFFGSRLNMNLREEKGWTYGVNSGVRTNSLGREGTFSIGTAVQPDKTAATVKEMLKELEGYLGEKPVTQAELDRFRTLIVKSYPAQFNSQRAYAQNAQRSLEFGLPYDYSKGYIDRMNAITVEDVRQAAKDTIKPDELVWMFVGNLEKIEQQVRDLNLGEVEIWDAYGNKVNSKQVASKH